MAASIMTLRGGNILILQLEKSNNFDKIMIISF